MDNPIATITTIAELEDCIGVAGTGVKMKVIDHVDSAAADWISKSTLAFVGWQTSSGPNATIAGGERGFASVDGETSISIPLASLDHNEYLEVGRGAGVLFLVKGTGETLRANGQIVGLTDTHVSIGIEECFVHCAKALKRSDFWQRSSSPPDQSAPDLMNQSRFLAYVTMNKEGGVDISPKGDPAGLLLRYEGDQALLPERPGNRLAFGFRNLLEQPLIAALALSPGQNAVVRFQGHAEISLDENKRNAFTVDGKLPKLVTVITNCSLETYESQALQSSGSWSDETLAPEIDSAAALVAHVKLNKRKGVKATLTKFAINRGLVQRGLDENYKNELY
ncbi:MAG: pyridoxamine 5-phosphate oxidase [Pseudomonadota bacterium]